MRYIALILILFVAAHFSFSQITTYQLTLKDSTLNILFLGDQNEVRIENMPIGSKLIYRNEIKDHCFGHSDLFSLTPMNQEDSVLHVYMDGREIYKKSFTLKRWPNPLAKLGILKDTFATVTEILKCPYLFIAFSDRYLSPNRIADLYAYNITFYTGGNNLDIKQFNINSRNKLSGVQFDSEVIKEIKSLKKGDKIKFDEIKAIGGLMCPRILSDITIHIIDHH